jgi:hypothetical protein
MQETARTPDALYTTEYHTRQSGEAAGIARDESGRLLDRTWPEPTHVHNLIMRAVLGTFVHILYTCRT